MVLIRQEAAPPRMGRLSQKGRKSGTHGCDRRGAHHLLQRLRALDQQRREVMVDDSQLLRRLSTHFGRSRGSSRCQSRRGLDLKWFIAIKGLDTGDAVALGRDELGDVRAQLLTSTEGTRVCRDCSCPDKPHNG